MTRSASLPFPLLAAALLLSSARAIDAQVRREFTEVHMGMPVRIVLHAADDATARAAAGAAFRRIAQLDATFSDYRADSELRRLEQRPGHWVAVSEPLFDVLRRALDVARLTDGAFDPTAGPLVALWRDARRNRTLPAQAAITAARRVVGWRHLELDTARRTVRLARPGMRLDLGGIAKGYILQAALASLRQHGVVAALLEAGGDIVAGAPPPGRHGWRILTPGAAASLAGRADALAHAAIATSGATYQFLERNGTRYSHVVDPRTGVPVTHDVTARVIAADAALADALATALTVDPSLAGPILRRFPDLVVDVAPTPVEPRRRAR